MASNRFISTNFWKDNYVVELDPTEKLIFIYLLTNKQTNIAGIYEINIREVAFDTGFDVEVVRRALEKFMAEGKIFMAEGWLGLRNWIKHQATNPSVLKGIDRQLQLLPDSLRQYIVTDDTGMSVGIDYDRLYTAYAQGQTYLTKLNLTLPNLTKPNGTNVAEATELVASENDDEKKPAKRQRTQELDGMFQYWASEVGYDITSKKKQNREYAGKLLNEYGKQDIALMIKAAALASEDQYAPGVSDFIDLYRKWDKLKLWGKKKGMRQHAVAQF